jgi:hypothetical protein
MVSFYLTSRKKKQASTHPKWEVAALICASIMINIMSIIKCTYQPDAIIDTFCCLAGFPTRSRNVVVIGCDKEAMQLRIVCVGFRFSLLFPPGCFSLTKNTVHLRNLSRFYYFDGTNIGTKVYQKDKENRL